MTVHYGLQAGIPVFREFGKRAIKLREPAGRDLGERAACVEALYFFSASASRPGLANKPYQLYFDKDPFQVSSMDGLQAC